MCGILGVIRLDSQKVHQEQLQELNDAIIHRGPDGEGYFVEDNVGLAMRRLSIIDLETGDQPIKTSDGRFVIVFNGEIYNYQEVRDELLDLGIKFTTHSDTEVILYGYQVWGKEVVSRLNGMFCFAIYDRTEHEVFIARDRIGEKQLYYALTSEYLVFGSEMKTPMAFGHRQLRLSALPEYLNYQYVGGTETAIEGISLLAEGHWMSVKTLTGDVKIHKYWDLAEAAASKNFEGSEEDAVEASYQCIRDSIALRMVSDVPITVMLSGGLDSSTLAYVLSEELNTSLTCFSLGFEDPEFDESRNAEVLVNHFDLNWERFFLKGEDITEHFPKYINHIDSLQANTAQMVYFFSCKKIHEAGFKVALNGNGGDELFAGYPTYRADVMHRAFRFVPGVFKSMMRFGAKQIPPSFGKVALDYKLNKFLENPFFSSRKAHSYWRTIFSPGTFQEISTVPGLMEQASLTSLYDRVYDEMNGVALGPFVKDLVADVRAWLTPMLPWADNTTMSHSVELRLPLLDYKLLELVYSFPDSYIFNGWQLKKMMKKFLASRIPSEILNRPKQGTHLPVSRWLNSDLKEIADHYLSAAVLNRNDLFNMTAVENMLSSHRKEEADNTFRLWTLLIFSAWQEHNRVTVA